ncbi:MAG TPA: hypothetical protein VK187_03025 [Geobacteraceae bacterium]|nr:hypothetical protein [Geobacteraceae bacterium]
MRRSTVRSGLRLIITAVVSVILAAFFHDDIAALLSLSPGGETQFIFLGLFWGGVFGFCGILVTVIGLLRAPGREHEVGLLRSMIILVALVLLFLYLLLNSFNQPERPQLRPGETITI